MQDTARRLGDLGRRVGAIGGARVARVELVALNEVVERFVTLVRGALPKDIEVDFIPGHELSSVTADPALLDQLLLNLCLNSRDALPRGGRITVETENVLVNGKFRESHPWAKPGRYVLLTVSDDGVGMRREIRERAFEPFFTTKAPGTGVGLGLATVYGIVQLHRGLLHLYTEVGRGTTVKVYLPAVERKAERVGPKLDGAVSGGTETILVAEDHDIVRGVVTRILERAGYDVITACDGEECIRLYHEHRERVALVLMDVVMPGLDGPAASARLKILHPGVKVLFASGSTERAISASVAASPDHEIGPVVPKPYEPDSLLRKIRSMLDGDDR